MAKGVNFGVVRDRPADEPGGRRSRRAGEDGTRGALAGEDASTVERHPLSLKAADAVRRPADDLVTASRGMTDSRDPGCAHPGQFFWPANPLPAARRQINFKGGGRP